MITKFNLYEGKYGFFSNDIFDAVISHDYNYVKSYFKDNQDPNILNNVNQNLLLKLTMDDRDDSKMVKLLVDNGIDLDMRIGFDSALIFCAFYGSYDSVKILIDAGADWDLVDGGGNTFLVFIQTNENFMTWLEENHGSKLKKFQRKKEFNL